MLLKRHIPRWPSSVERPRRRRSRKARVPQFRRACAKSSCRPRNPGTGSLYTHYPKGKPQITTIKVTLAPHTVLPWHTHPFPNSVYVLSGTLTLHDRDSGKTLVVHQGQAAGESVNDVHRGESGDEPTVLLITYAGTPGVPISVPAEGEKPEY